MGLLSRLRPRDGRGERSEEVGAAPVGPQSPADPAPASPPITASDLAELATPGWARLAPPGPLLDPMPLVVATDFERVLPSRRRLDPVLVQPLGHLIEPDGPGGVVEGLAVLRPISAPAASPQAPPEAAPDLVLPVPPSPEPGDDGLRALPGPPVLGHLPAAVEPALRPVAVTSPAPARTVTPPTARPAPATAPSQPVGPSSAPASAVPAAPATPGAVGTPAPDHEEPLSLAVAQRSDPPAAVRPDREPGASPLLGSPPIVPGPHSRLLTVAAPPPGHPALDLRVVPGPVPPGVPSANGRQAPASAAPAAERAVPAPGPAGPSADQADRAGPARERVPPGPAADETALDVAQAQRPAAPETELRPTLGRDEEGRPDGAGGGNDAAPGSRADGDRTTAANGDRAVRPEATPEAGQAGPELRLATGRSTPAPDRVGPGGDAGAPQAGPTSSRGPAPAGRPARPAPESGATRPAEAAPLLGSRPPARPGLGGPIGGLPATAVPLDKLRLAESGGARVHVVGTPLPPGPGAAGDLPLRGEPPLGRPDASAPPAAAAVSRPGPGPAPSAAPVRPLGPWPAVHPEAPAAVRSRPAPMAPLVAARRLSPRLREGFEVKQAVGQQFGVDLSAVPIDRSATAAAESSGLGALAFTDGRGVHIPSPVGSLDSGSGRAVLAHELTHVAQRLSHVGPVPAESTPAGRRLERQAVRVQQAVATAPQAGLATAVAGVLDAPARPSTPRQAPGPVRPGVATRPMPAAATPDVAAPVAARPGAELEHRPTPNGAAPPAASAPPAPVARPAPAVDPAVMEAVMSRLGHVEALADELLTRQASAPISARGPAAPAAPVAVPAGPAQRICKPGEAADPKSHIDPPSPKELEKLARLLFPVLRHELRAGLREDRDRSGLLSDMYGNW